MSQKVGKSLLFAAIPLTTTANELFWQLGLLYTLEN